MNLIKKIFSVNTCILLGSFLFLVASMKEITEINYDIHKLVPHTGILQGKSIISEKKGKETINTLKLRLVNDATEYTVSMDVDYVDESIKPGDSIRIFTKNISS